MKKYANEKEGQIEFYEDFLPRVDSTLTDEEIFNDYTDGIVNGNILEFKVTISDLNMVLSQAIRYLSAMRIKGKELPKNILLISLNQELAYRYDSNDYLEKIEKVYIGPASKGIKGFSAEKYLEIIDYSNQLGQQRIIEILKTNEVTKININEDCIVGWAERYYRENHMNKLLRVMFIIIIIAMFSASILQLFFPVMMGSNSEYGIAIGWQREIGFWNLAILPILIGINLRYDYYFLRIIVISLIVGGVGFGTNHLLGFIDNTSKLVSLVGAIENYLFALLWILGLKIESAKYRADKGLDNKEKINYERS